MIVVETALPLEPEVERLTRLAVSLQATLDHWRETKADTERKTAEYFRWAIRSQEERDDLFQQLQAARAENERLLKRLEGK